MHTTTLRVLAALLAVVVAVSSVRAAGPENQTNEDAQSRILKQLQKATLKLSEIQIRQDIQSTAMQNDLNQLKADVNRINEELRRFSPVKTNISASINPEAVPPAMGKLVLTNNYNQPAKFYVNGQAIPVAPSQQASVDVPAGRFTWKEGGGVCRPVTCQLQGASVLPEGQCCAAYAS